MKINTDKDCNIVIYDDTEYPIEGLKYTESVSLYIVVLNKCDSQEILYNKIILHDYKEKQPIVLGEKSYGFISVYHYILPLSGDNYYSDGEKIYFKNSEGVSREVEEQELVEVNPDAYGLIKHTYNFFSVCNLRKCYISLCQKIFNSRAFDRCFNNKVDSDLIYRRDLVWAALNVIQYLIDSHYFCEAQRLLERITSCNGLCTSAELGTKGCCCS